MNALTVIHKYIRQELFDLTRHLASAGPDDVGALKEAVEEAAGLLHGHAAGEEARVEPLLRDTDPALADCLRSDHRRLEDQFERFRAGCAVLDPAQREACADALSRLYLDWNRFLADYLTHLDDEERVMLPALGGEVLPLAMIADSMDDMPPDKEQAFLDKLWRVTAPREREAIETARARQKH
jgi:hypothetical protein